MCEAIETNVTRRAAEVGARRNDKPSAGTNGGERVILTVVVRPIAMHLGLHAAACAASCLGSCPKAAVQLSHPSKNSAL